MTTWDYRRLLRSATLTPLAEVDLGGMVWPPNPGTSPLIDDVIADVKTLQVHYAPLIKVVGALDCRVSAAAVANTVDARRAHLRDLFSTLRREPFNAHIMQEAACILQSLSNQSRAQPQLFRALAAGVNGAVMRGFLPQPYPPLTAPADQPPPFIVKVSQAAENDLELFNEAAVGLYGTNSLRAEIPNFMYVYGAYRCGRSRAGRGNEIVTCDAQGPERALYVMIETIADASTLYDWIRDHIDDADLVVQLHALLAQIFLALAIARERIDFTHSDLSTRNVMIRQLSSPRTLYYQFADGQVYYVVTDKVATLIDFGRSHVRVPLDNLPRDATLAAAEKLRLVVDDKFQMGGVKFWMGLTPWVITSLYDITRLIGTTALNLEEPQEREVWAWLRPLCRDDRSFERLFARREEWTGRYFDVAPYGVDISLRDFVDAGFALTRPANIFRQWSPDLPPPFACDGVCTPSPLNIAVSPARRARR